MGGGNRQQRYRKPLATGLSPRGRGKPIHTIADNRRRGSIPAWAGETTAATAPLTPTTVYPRVGGGNTARRRMKGKRMGLSPRGRGKPDVSSNECNAAGSIPAWAGETSRRSTRRRYTAVYPRVGGGNRISARRCQGLNGLSPRGRGKPTAVFPVSKQGGSIPAWAGETDLGVAVDGFGRVYPRVGGGNQSAQIQTLHDGGLSPRGRGKRNALHSK